MNILILGSEGFIGGHLVSFYISKKFSVTGADLMEIGSKEYTYRKISRLSPEYEELLQEIKFDVCINAAGSGNVSYSMTHPVSDFEANSLDTIRILDGLRRHQQECKYLHISSAAVYGNPKSLPIHEDDELSPLSPYGWHKLMAEQVCKEFTHIYKVPTAIVRPFSVFGPGLKKQLIWDLFRKITLAEEGSNIELWGTGMESRDFIFIDDLVASFNLVLEKGCFKAEAYNIGSGTESTVKEVASMLVKELGKDVEIVFNQQVRSGDPQNWRSDISRIQALGFEPAASLYEGIKQTAKWLKGLE